MAKEKMQGEHNENLEVKDNNKKRVRCIKVAIAAVMIGTALFCARSYIGNASDIEVPQEEAVTAPVVILGLVETVELAGGQEYIGKVEAIQAVDIKPQVAGEITKVHFTEGSIVKAGDLLFTLDGKQYEATIQLRKAELAKAEANHNRAVKYYERLKKADSRSVSLSDLEQAESDVLQGKADIAQAKAALRLAQIDYEYTKIKAPITGQIGEAMFTKGNHVSPQADVLANITQIDPIRISFAMPDREYIEQQRAKNTQGQPYIAQIHLPDDSLYPHAAEREFESNRMDSRTGTIIARLRVKNDEALLVPGGMVRVVVKPSQIIHNKVVPSTAIMADGESDFVYVVDADNVAHRRSVKLGEHFGNRIAVIEGLNQGERVVVQGVQFVNIGAPVTPISKDVAMSKKGD
jgi:RND family efflux transporter, MFP subunit